MFELELAFYLTSVTKVDVMFKSVMQVMSYQVFGKMFIQFIAPVLWYDMRSKLLPEYLKKKICTLL